MIDREEVLKQITALVYEYAVNWEDWDCLPDRLAEWIEKHTQDAKSQIVEQILELLKPEWEDPDIKGDKIEDTGTYAVTNPVVRNQLRLQIKEEINKL